MWLPVLLSLPLKIYHRACSRKPQVKYFGRLTRFLFSRDLQMRHLAAYLLLQIGGNASPSAADIKKVLGAVGIEAEDERLEKLISELEGKDVNAVSSFARV